MYADWDAASSSDAQQVLASITSFEFIIVFVTIYQYLSHLSGITVKLQKRALDIVEAYEMINEVATLYKKERKNVESGFDQIYAQRVRMAEKIGAVVKMPRIALRQQHYSNAGASSPYQYFLRNITIPFLDHVITSIKEQFSASAIIATSLLGLVPSVLCKRDNVRLEAAADMYSTDLPLPELLNMELK